MHDLLRVYVHRRPGPTHSIQAEASVRDNRGQKS